MTTTTYNKTDCAVRDDFEELFYRARIYATHLPTEEERVSWVSNVAALKPTITIPTFIGGEGTWTFDITTFDGKGWTETYEGTRTFALEEMGESYDIFDVEEAIYEEADACDDIREWERTDTTA